MTDKEQATKRLLNLAEDEDWYVRWRAAGALGSAFPHMTDKEQTWKHMLDLLEDEDRYFRLACRRPTRSAFPPHNR